jgi:hypothetical protein
LSSWAAVGQFASHNPIISVRRDEAVGIAAPALRDLGWSEDIDQASEFRVDVQSPTVVHTIDRFKLRRWVQVPGGRGPREVVLKQNLKKTLRWFE